MDVKHRQDWNRLFEDNAQREIKNEQAWKDQLKFRN